jgi:integrase
VVGDRSAAGRRDFVSNGDDAAFLQHVYDRSPRTKSRPEGQAVRLPDQLVAHLRRWKARGQRYVVEWNGQPISRIDRAFRAAAKDAGFGYDVTPHTLRHTVATWLMQNGSDLWDAAGFLGMTVETLERVYGHHHPDHQSSARGAFKRDRNRQ